MTALLRTEGLTKRFGGITAVDACTIEVQKGSITGLIGLRCDPLQSAVRCPRQRA